VITLYVVCTVLLFVGGAVVLTWLVSSWRKDQFVDARHVNWVKKMKQ
jgi:hypothetical protein